MPPFFSFFASRSAGFSPPLCYQASRVLLHQSYVRICHPLSLYRFGFFLLGKSFMTPSSNLGDRSVGLPWVRRTASPDTVQLHIEEVSPDIRSRSYMPARPSPQRHIAGSLFATYLGSTSYFLRTPHLWKCPCPVGVVLPSGNGVRFTSRPCPEGRQVRHARRTSTTPQ